MGKEQQECCTPSNHLTRPLRAGGFNKPRNLRNNSFVVSVVVATRECHLGYFLCSLSGGDITPNLRVTLFNSTHLHATLCP